MKLDVKQKFFMFFMNFLLSCRETFVIFPGGKTYSTFAKKNFFNNIKQKHN